MFRRYILIPIILVMFLAVACVPEDLEEPLPEENGTSDEEDTAEENGAEDTDVEGTDEEDEFSASEEEIEMCSEGGGTWELMPNTCVDSCESAREENVACGQAMTEGCNCGDGMCWDGESCVDI